MASARDQLTSAHLPPASVAPPRSPPSSIRPEETMGSRAALVDWKAFNATGIPTKGIKLPPVFEETLRLAASEKASLHILELGCGCGELAHHLASRGHVVVGVDANEDAIGLAKQQTQTLGDNNNVTFLVDDVTVTTFRLPLKNNGARISSFDFCILQLLLSIVGDKEKRSQTISTSFESLKSGGYVYLSCSGISDKINPNYKKLYEQDYPATEEMYTYFSRDGDGNIIYATHHFSAAELKKLMEQAGFIEIFVQEIREASSRRPEEVANFLYAVARKP